MKVGLFFGSFNPIHIGHLALANYLVQFSDLKELWFVVSPHNPLKEKKSLLAFHHRVRLVEEAIGNYKQFKVSSIESKLSQPSYTINTLAYLKEKYPKKDFVLLMGTDSLQSLAKWKNYTQLLNDFTIYAYPRTNSTGGEFKNHPNVKIVNAPQIEISSSFIRKCIEDKKDVRFFLHQQTWNYIEEMGFYKKSKL